MAPFYHFQQIPPSRIATFDVTAVGIKRHHISVILEFDVTDSRNKLKSIKRQGRKVSFTSWIIKAISLSLEQYKVAASYLYNKKKLIIFEDLNFSIIVEKQHGDQKVPIPLIVEKTDKKSIDEIHREIEQAKEVQMSASDIVLNKSRKFSEKLYYYLPGFCRRWVWYYFLHHPRLSYKKMGNVMLTSPGMMGQIKGWFLHKTIHPISFGIGSVIKKPWVVDDEIRIREILNMTILFDHDVIDGAPFTRFLNTLTYNIEQGQGL